MTPRLASRALRTPALPLIGRLWIAAALTVWTGWEYLRSTWPHLSGPEI